MEVEHEWALLMVLNEKIRRIGQMLRTVDRPLNLDNIVTQRYTEMRRLGYCSNVR